MSELRPIDITGLHPVAPAEQPAPQLVWVPLSDLMIDGRYQRPLNKSNIAAIRRIAEQFRWSRFSPVLVAPIEGGRYAVIDGQHRAHAAAVCGFEQVPAMVVLVPSSEQAQAFIEINTKQIRVSTNNVYRAALAAGQPWAVSAHKAVSAAGCRLMHFTASTKAKKPGEVYAVGLIRHLIEAGHADAVTAGLSALMAYDNTSASNFSDALLSPWLHAVAASGQRDLVVLSPVLRAHRPWLVIERADRLAAETGKPRAVCRRQAFTALIKREAQQ